MKQESRKECGFWNQSRRWLERRPVACLVAPYVICIVIYLATVPLPRVDGQLVGSDGAFYYAYLPTLLLDHDLDFGNQYADLMPPAHKAKRSSGTQRYFNKYTVGTALLWSPFFLIGHLLAIILNSVGLEIALDGTGYIYQVPTLLGSLTYGFVAILLIYRSCRRFFSRPASALTAILIWLASNVIYYMIAEPSMSHTCSLFAVALFVELWLASRPAPATGQWILLGMAAGLVAIVRPQDSTCLVLPVLDALIVLRVSVLSDLWRCFKGFLIFALSFLVIFAPQMMLWQLLHGSATTTGYSVSGTYWRFPQILKVLFSLKHGLFLWHPVLLVAAIGLFFLYRWDRRLSGLLGIAFAVQLCLIGAWHGWHGGDAFGGRLLIGTFPVLAPGLAALLEWMSKRGAWALAAIASVCLIAWNALFFAQYRLGYIEMDSRISLHQLTLGKLSMLRDLWEHARLMLQ